MADYDKLSGDDALQYNGAACETSAPQGFDPDASGYRDAPPGTHEMRITSLEIKVEKQVTVPDKDDDRYGQKIRLNHATIRLECVSGEHAGATLMADVPIPTRGVVMPRFYANQWANFMKSFGHPLPANVLWPEGFTFTQLVKGPRAMVTCGYSVRDGVQQTRADGRPYVNVNLFGYAPLHAAGSTPAATKAKQAAVPTAAPPKVDVTSPEFADL